MQVIARFKRQDFVILNDINMLPHFGELPALYCKVDGCFRIWDQAGKYMQQLLHTFYVRSGQ